MDIGEAVAALKLGKRVSRAGWNGKGMWLVLVPYEGAHVPQKNGGDAPMLPFVLLRTAGGENTPWTCSQTDLLASDWALVEA